MYSEIYVKPNVKEQFDNKYLADLKLEKDDFDGEKYTYNSDVAEFLYQDELNREFKSWLFCDFSDNEIEMEGTDGAFQFYDIEEKCNGENIQARGELIRLREAYLRCIEYCQLLTNMETFAQRNFYRALDEEQIFDNYDIVVVRHYN